MERLIPRMFVIAGLLFAIAGAVHFAPKAEGVTKTEDQLEDLTPEKVMGVRYTVGAEDPAQSYKMDKVSYDTLKPFGIVCRVFEIDGDRYDAVVIASRSKDSFHDPRVCFSAQGWNIEKFEPTTIQTRTRGEIPAMIIETFSDEKRRQLAAFLYRGPGGFYGSTQSLKFAFLREQLMFGDNLDGVFYRFIPNFENPDLDGETQRLRLKKFIGEFLDEAKVSSGGYF